MSDEQMSEFPALRISIKSEIRIHIKSFWIRLSAVDTRVNSSFGVERTEAVQELVLF